MKKDLELEELKNAINKIYTPFHNTKKLKCGCWIRGLTFKFCNKHWKIAKDITNEKLIKYAKYGKLNDDFNYKNTKYYGVPIIETIIKKIKVKK